MMLQATKSFLTKNLKWLVLALSFGIMMVPSFSYMGSGDFGASIMDQAHNTDQYSTTTGAITSAPTTHQPSFSIKEVSAEVLLQVVDGVSAALESLSTNTAIAGAGSAIMSFLVIIMIAWNLLKAMMGNGFNQFIEDMIMLFGIWGIAYAILHAGGIDAIRSFIDGIAASFGGADMSSLKGALTHVVSNGFTALGNIISMPMGNTEMNLWKLNDAFGLLVVAIIQLLAKLICGLLVAFALIVYIANVVTAFASIILATALASVMVPFLIVPGLSFLFDGWLRFFLVACLMKAVGAFFMSLTMQLMNQMSNIAQHVYMMPDTDVSTMVSANLMLYLCLIILGGLAALLMSTVPQISQGLISGSGVASGFGGIRPMTSSPSLRTVSNISSAGLQAAKNSVGSGSSGSSGSGGASNRGGAQSSNSSRSMGGGGSSAGRSGPSGGSVRKP